jgi:3-deoxy-D-manno-octulosonic-acid transferase
MRCSFTRQKIAQSLYQLLLPLLLFFLAPGQILKMLRRKESASSLAQRFGIFSPQDLGILSAKKNGVWIHAVSVGEVNIAIRIAREWLQRYPRLPILLTTTTKTGREVAEKQLGSSVGILHNPLDFLPVVKNFLNHLQPRVVVLVESELWPNCIWEAERRKIPLALVNARVSSRSERRYALLSPLIRPLYDKIRIICAQSEKDAARLVRLGARPDSIRMVDSMKFDVSEAGETFVENTSSLLRKAGFPADAIILLGGSTHRGEEELLAEIYKTLLIEHPRLRLVLVPRHVERCASISKKLSEKGFTVVSRKQITQADDTNTVFGDILLVDTTGELKNFYSVSHITFVGKSLLGRGGQNFLEALQFCRPVIVGPHMDNFSEITEYFVKNNAIIQINNPSDLKAAVARCLNDPESAAEMAARAKSLFNQRLGATKRTIEALDELIAPVLRAHSPR